MRNFVTIVLDERQTAYKALHALWVLDGDGDITVHGTAVVHRDDWGHFEVDTKETHPVFATAVGVGIGALLGALAGPMGMAVGAAGAAALGAAITGGVAVGATTGAIVGGAIDMDRASTRKQADIETGLVLNRDQSAVIADVSESSAADIDTALEGLGGQIYRRSKSSLEYDAQFRDGFIPYDDYLYPYEYVPGRYHQSYGW